MFTPNTNTGLAAPASAPPQTTFTWNNPNFGNNTTTSPFGTGGLFQNATQPQQPQQQQQQQSAFNFGAFGAPTQPQQQQQTQPQTLFSFASPTQSQPQQQQQSPFSIFGSPTQPQQQQQSQPFSFATPTQAQQQQPQQQSTFSIFGTPSQPQQQQKPLFSFGSPTQTQPQPQQQSPFSIFGSPTQSQPQQQAQPQQQQQFQFFQPQLQQQQQQQQNQVSPQPQTGQTPPLTLFGQPLPQPQQTPAPASGVSPAPAPTLFPQQPQQQQQQAFPANNNNLQPQQQQPQQPFPIPWLGGHSLQNQQYPLPTYTLPQPGLNLMHFSTQLPNGTPMSLIVPTGHASSLALEDLRSRSEMNYDRPSLQTNNLESFREWLYPPPRPPPGSPRPRTTNDILSTRSSSDLMDYNRNRNWHPLERKSASTTLSSSDHRRAGGSYSLHTLYQREIDKSRQRGYCPRKAKTYESSFFGGRHDQNSLSLYRRNLKYLSAMEAFEDVPKISTPNWEYQQARKWKVLDTTVVKKDLESRWQSASDKTTISPRRDHEIGAPKTFSERFHCKCEAFTRSVGPPLDSDRRMGKSLREYLWAETDILGPPPVPREREVVASLPSRLDSTPTPTPPPPARSSPPSPYPPQARPSSSKKAMNMSTKPSSSKFDLEEKTSVVFIRKTKKQVRFTDSVEEREEEKSRRKMNTPSPSPNPGTTPTIKNDSEESKGELRLSQTQLRFNASSMNLPSTNSISFVDNAKANDGGGGGGEPESTNTKYHCKAGVKLSRPGYYCVPDLRGLDDLINPQTGDCFVQEFEIGHREYGSVIFDGFINVAGLDLDKIVEFSNMSFELELCDSIIKRLTPATVTLKNVTGKPRSISELRRACERFNGTFVDYDPDKGLWVFRINEDFSCNMPPIIEDVDE